MRFCALPFFLVLVEENIVDCPSAWASGVVVELGLVGFTMERTRDFVLIVSCRVKKASSYT